MDIPFLPRFFSTFPAPRLVAAALGIVMTVKMLDLDAEALSSWRGVAWDTLEVGCLEGHRDVDEASLRRNRDCEPQRDASAERSLESW